MLLRFSFGWTQEADAIEVAVSKTLDRGFRTADIFRGEGIRVSTSEMAHMIVGELQR